MKFILTVMTFFLFSCGCMGQKLHNLKIEKVYLDNPDKTKNHYTIIYPPTLPWKGYIFLIPGLGQTSENVLQQTELPKKLALNGILTIIPTFQDGELSFGVDSLSQQSFNRILIDVTSKHKLIDQKFYVGGFSIGEVVQLNMQKIQLLNQPQFLRLTHHLILNGFIIQVKERYDYL